MEQEVKTKFCKHCGAKIPIDAVLCTACGRQVEEMRHEGGGGAAAAPSIVVQNVNQNNVNVGGYGGMGIKRNKWVAFFLCLFFGWMGAHKFYECKAGWGIVYLCTFGLLGIGWLIDLLNLLGKPNPYYV